MTTSTEVRRGRPASLTREQVEDTAFALVQEHGYDSGSMRELARVLGVSAMAVQRVTGGREALDEALVDRLIEAERRSPAAWPADWRGALVEYAQLVRGLCRRHPSVLAAFARRRLASPYAQEVVDLVLGRLMSAGLSPERAAAAFLAVRDYVTGHVSVEVQRPAAQELELIPDVPHLQSASTWLTDVTVEERFTSGLQIVLAGVAAQLP